MVQSAWQAASFLEALLLALDEEAPVGPYVPAAFRVLAPVKALESDFFVGMLPWVRVIESGPDTGGLVQACQGDLDLGLVQYSAWPQAARSGFPATHRLTAAARTLSAESLFDQDFLPDTLRLSRTVLPSLVTRAKVQTPA